DASHNLTVFQQGTYAPDSGYRWMGSMAMDQSGNMALGFSLSSSTLHPEIHYTGRLAGDAGGQMTQGEGTIINGAGSQIGGSTNTTAVTSGSAGTVTLTASAPSGLTPTLSPTSVTAGGRSTLTVAASSTVAAGTYTVTVTGTEGSATHATSVSVTVNGTPVK